MSTPSYKLSAEATADVEKIIEDGILAFGLTQALKYHLGLESRFELLAQFPRIGAPTYDLRSGLYHYTYEAHAIFYTIQPNNVSIVRILNGKADFGRQF
jgi:toxin ParE1/3/4